MIVSRKIALLTLVLGAQVLLSGCDGGGGGFGGFFGGSGGSDVFASLFGGGNGGGDDLGGLFENFQNFSGDGGNLGGGNGGFDSFVAGPPPVAVVHHPEPASMVLFGMGLLGAAGFRRRRTTPSRR